MKKKLAVISVISDIYTDQRVLRAARTLEEMGYDIYLIGRKKQLNSLMNNHIPFQTIHIDPVFQKNVLMYAFFNILLFIKVLKIIVCNRKKDVLLYANDLDTLLPNFIISKIFQLPLVYDTHEIFTEVPELQNKTIKKKIWETLEKCIVPKLNFVITVNKSIAEWYRKKYPTSFYVVRNISDQIKSQKIKTKKELNLPEHKKIIILQGTGINIHRGAEELVQSMQYLSSEYLLLIIGGGDVIQTLKEMTNSLKITEKIIFKDRLPAEELYHYTCHAHLGISIDKPNNLNYLYSLPNKIFSYIHAHIPILASRLPEIEQIINQYQIGTFIDNHEPKHIAIKIEEALNHPEYNLWKANTYKAESELNWETEKHKLKTIIQKYINH
ncbi:MAG: glycosyltransferase [Bacteroidia bacterium]|nr:glycosyltransferase [Bacteroidia bacterium]